MNARRVEVTFSVEDWAALNEARGFESRASFVKRHYKRALESAQTDEGIASPEVLKALRESWESPELDRQFMEETPVLSLDPTGDPPTFSKPPPAPKPQRVPSVKSGRDVLNAQRQERMNKQRKP